MQYDNDNDEPITRGSGCVFCDLDLPSRYIGGAAFHIVPHHHPIRCPRHDACIPMIKKALDLE